MRNNVAKVGKKSIENNMFLLGLLQWLLQCTSQNETCVHKQNTC